MEIHKIEQMLVEAQSTGQKDVKKLIEDILLCEELNMNYADKEIVRQSMAIGVKVYEAMAKGIIVRHMLPNGCDYRYAKDMRHLQLELDDMGSSDGVEMIF